jgi:hypothetical protein
LQELEALCYAIRPTEDFRHKIGMGKPLGLGQVRLDPIGLLLIDRRRRYQEKLGDPRYHEVWWQDQDKISASLDARYDLEKSANATDGAPNPRSLAAHFREQRQNRLDLDALELIGNPKAVVAPVRYPLRQTQAIGTGKHYEWFMRNEGDPNPQRLGLPNGLTLPTLKKN